MDKTNTLSHDRSGSKWSQWITRPSVIWRWGGEGRGGRREGYVRNLAELRLFLTNPSYSAKSWSWEEKLFISAKAGERDRGCKTMHSTVFLLVLFISNHRNLGKCFKSLQSSRGAHFQRWNNLEGKRCLFEWGWRILFKVGEFPDKKEACKSAL